MFKYVSVTYLFFKTSNIGIIKKKCFHSQAKLDNQSTFNNIVFQFLLLSVDSGLGLSFHSDQLFQ